MHCQKFQETKDSIKYIKQASTGAHRSILSSFF